MDRLKTEHQIRRWIQECRRGHPGLSRIFLFLDFDGVINTYQNANYRQIFTGTLTKDDITDLTTPACMQQTCADYKTKPVLEQGLIWLDSIASTEASMTYARNPHGAEWPAWHPSGSWKNSHIRKKMYC